MKKINGLSVLLGALLVCGSVFAAENVNVVGAWARATAPGQDVAMVDLTLVSEQSSQLVGISSPSCKTVEIHGMTHDNGMMKMRQVQSVDLPAGKRVSLSDSGYHLMLIGLNAPLKAGASVALTLSIRGADQTITQQEIKAEVKPMTAAMPTGEHHMHH